MSITKRHPGGVNADSTVGNVITTQGENQSSAETGALAASNDPKTIKITSGNGCVILLKNPA